MGMGAVTALSLTTLVVVECVVFVGTFPFISVMVVFFTLIVTVLMLIGFGEGEPTDDDTGWIGELMALVVICLVTWWLPRRLLTLILDVVFWRMGAAPLLFWKMVFLALRPEEEALLLPPEGDLAEVTAATVGLAVPLPNFDPVGVLPVGDTFPEVGEVFPEGEVDFPPRPGEVFPPGVGEVFPPGDGEVFPPGDGEAFPPGGGDDLPGVGEVFPVVVLIPVGEVFPDLELVLLSEGALARGVLAVGAKLAEDEFLFKGVVVADVEPLKDT